ncbi:putative MFS family arabinose efflux permease [Saccharopolyspora erythraea NRRL 2338]|uniref:Major facilitator superfamily (MFS) profile domain-containing protein n=2 Tax=Saccharopolyspora erythraea TaxID=1836 RepID=A0ABN1DPQ7_SACER|nr:MFS transporter [Saccharopolyspora erythraea]EQD86075.1 major facilitator transporter [Saccharopolyspora erythraea D]PFG97931.1 putative MFS family arabinose efflux permease [Saccharopolyspora erythraea NRRL 2338]QRK88062.1 MFS transporter [Saccharopolyspora erythraea]
MSAARPKGAPGHGTRLSRGKNLALLTASTSMDNAENSITTVMFPLMRDAFGLSAAALGTITAVAKVAGAATSVPWAMLGRRYSRRSVLAICSGFWGVWIIAAGTSTNFTAFLVLYSIGAAGFAGSGAIALEILGDVYADHHRGRATGILYAGVAVITGASAPVFGSLAHFDNGWRYGYLLSGTVCLMVGVLVLVFLDDPRHQPARHAPRRGDLAAEVRKAGDGLRELLRIRSFRYLLAQRLFSGQNVMMTFGIVFLVEERGFSTSTAAVAAVPFSLGYVVGTLLGGRVLDRLHLALPRSGRVVMLQVSQLGFAAIAFVTLQITAENIASYAALFAMLGLLQGQVPVVNRPLVMAVVPPHLRAMAFAVSVYLVESLAYGGYALLTGYLGDQIGLRSSLVLITAGLTAANGLASAALYRPYARDSAEKPHREITIHAG